jgi:hypothetical protein
MTAAIFVGTIWFAVPAQADLNLTDIQVVADPDGEFHVPAQILVEEIARRTGLNWPVVDKATDDHTFIWFRAPIVEIGREPRVNIGDIATLWDWQDGSRPEDVSAECGASVYDLTMHLNPLLARTLV